MVEFHREFVQTVHLERMLHYYAWLSCLNVDMSIYEKARKYKPKRKMRFVNWKKV